MAAPLFHSIGTVVRGSGAINVSWGDHATDDIGVLLVESANQAVATPAGWTLIGNVGTGTAGVALATAVYAFWKRATSAAEATVTVADSGTRQTGVIMVFRGCITSGSPIDVSATSVQAAANVSVSMPGVTTTVVEDLIVNVMTNSLGISAATVQPSTLVNASVTNLSKRVNTQQDGTGGGGATDNSLPVGLSAFGSGGAFGDVGEGPGMDTVGPRCTVLLYVPNTADIGAQIDIADTHNITLVLNCAGNKPSFSTTVGGTLTLDMGKYEANVRRFRPDADNTGFADRIKFADAVRRRRIVFYVVDEPNLRNADNANVPDISPVQVNQMALIYKAVWQGYQPLTIVRCAANTLFSGWGGLSRPSGGYTGVDYCWLQYNNNHGKGGTNTWGVPRDPRDIWQEQRDIIEANNMQMGLCVSLNLWAGGIGQDFLGVTAKWDTDGPGGSSTLGYVLGDREGAQQAQVVTGTLSNTNKSVIANPNWIRKFTELAAADPDIPFVLFWQHVTPSSPSDEFINFYQRSDFQSALDDAITTGLARTTFAGWRTAK